MEQKTTKKNKRRLWSVYVFVERQVQEGRSVKRRSRLTTHISDRYIAGPVVTVVHEFLYLNVTRMYKKDGILHIHVGAGKKEVHRHEIKDVVSIQTREYRRDGRIE